MCTEALLSVNNMAGLVVHTSPTQYSTEAGLSRSTLEKLSPKEFQSSDLRRISRASYVHVILQDGLQVFPSVADVYARGLRRCSLR